ncbi:MAG TPA: cytochrome C [Candidatus Bathyarchaeia archaeon]|nr:cytochrome C [Candidatus Bathyarchaeia archaeon]
MMRRKAFALVMGAIALAMFMGCSAISQTDSVPPKHPEELAGMRPDCRECHEDVSTGALKPYASFRHSTVFIKQHSMYASQGQNLCASCHAPSFCQTCHIRQDELKPSTKMGDRPGRVFQHRGDYVVLHQLDGRLDPGSCFRCHGNKNDVRCQACHR